MAKNCSIPARHLATKKKQKTIKDYNDKQIVIQKNIKVEFMRDLMVQKSSLVTSSEKQISMDNYNFYTQLASNIAFLKKMTDFYFFYNKKMLNLL